MAQAIRVLVVDDHPVVREGISAMLSRISSLAVLGDAADGQQALDMVRSLKPDVVLMDLRLPVMDGVMATARIVRDFPETKVLILTTYDQDEMIVSGLRAGAKGYLLKDAPKEEIARAISRVHVGEMVLHPIVAARMVEYATGAAGAPAEQPVVTTAEGPLSERENDVLRCLADGMANKEIAARLNIAEATVKTHLVHLYAKLGVSDRTEAVTAAIRQGWLRLR
jgi:DNA-binding NarL/FixJ family response regulator